MSNFIKEYQRPQSIPVLVLAYNRPSSLANTFKKLREFGCEKVYVSVDGPKTNADISKQSEIKLLISEFQPEDRYVKFGTSNLGLRRAVTEGVNWFFEHERFGIILEDDLELSYSFFEFCYQNYLRHYVSSDIGVISANCFLPLIQRNSSIRQVYKSIFFHCWGWATWREIWHLYDDLIEYDDNFFEIQLPSILSFNKASLHQWKEEIRNLLLENRVNSWAYRMQYSLWKNRKYSLVSTKNLAKNIGFGSEATHSNTPPKWYEEHCIDERLDSKETVYACVNANLNNDANELSVLRSSKGGFNCLACGAEGNCAQTLNFLCDECGCISRYSPKRLNQPMLLKRSLSQLEKNIINDFLDRLNTIISGTKRIYFFGEHSPDLTSINQSVNFFGKLSPSRILDEQYLASIKYDKASINVIIITLSRTNPENIVPISNILQMAPFIVVTVGETIDHVIQNRSTIQSRCDFDEIDFSYHFFTQALIRPSESYKEIVGPFRKIYVRKNQYTNEIIRSLV